MSIPLSGYAFGDGKQDSPFLMAVARFQDHVGDRERGVVIALATGLLACAAVLAALRPRLGVPIALGGAVVAVAAASLGATSYDIRAAQRMELTFADNGGWTWVDDSALGAGSVLVTPGADRSAAEVDLFWNRDLQRVLRMPTAPRIDVFGDTPTTIAADGSLVADGVPVRGPLLVEESYAPVVLDDARLVRRTASASLWQPRGDVQVAMLTVGRYVDGWLDPKAQITVWPQRNAPTHMPPWSFASAFRAGSGSPAQILELTAPGYLAAGRRRPGSARHRSHSRQRPDEARPDLPPWTDRDSGRRPRRRRPGGTARVRCPRSRKAPAPFCR